MVRGNVSPNVRVAHHLYAVHLRQLVHWYVGTLCFDGPRTDPRPGVVVESFYYVFQMTGGAKEITREEMRSFKKVWAEFSNPKTGYLERHRFTAFFNVSSLYLSVRSRGLTRFNAAFERNL